MEAIRVVPLGARSPDRQTFPAPLPPLPSCRGTWFAILSTERDPFVCLSHGAAAYVIGISYRIVTIVSSPSGLYRWLAPRLTFHFLRVFALYIRTRRTMPGARRRGRPRTAWTDNIKTRTGLPVEESVRMTENRYKRRKYSTSTVWPAVGSRTAKEQNGTCARERSGVDLARIFGGASARVIRLCVCAVCRVTMLTTKQSRLGTAGAAWPRPTTVRVGPSGRSCHDSRCRRRRARCTCIHDDTRQYAGDPARGKEQMRELRG